MVDEGGVVYGGESGMELYEVMKNCSEGIEEKRHPMTMSWSASVA